MDDADLEWIFLQHERRLKSTLYTDFHGKKLRRRRLAEEAKRDTSDSARLPLHTQYARQRFSDRIGHCVPNSPQALTRHKHELCEAAMPGNLGPPTAMTTTVANAHTGPIVAHVRKGAFVAPDPEDTFAHLTKRVRTNTVTAHATIVQKDFMRRTAEIERLMYQREHDGRRGRQSATSRRREHQKRGPGHYHYNEFAEPCGKRRRLVHVPMDSADLSCTHSLVDMTPPPPPAPAVRARLFQKSKVPPLQLVADKMTQAVSCSCVSRYCLRAGRQCHLPAEADGTDYHMTHHNAHATAEMCRPYPLGSVTHAPPAPPALDGADLTSTFARLEAQLWTDSRSVRGSGTAWQTTCTGSLLTRLRGACDVTMDTDSTDSPMGFGDLLSGYYYRRVQMNYVVHVCMLGYCRKSWTEPCKYQLPEKEVVEQLRADDDAVRMRPRTGKKRPLGL